MKPLRWKNQIVSPDCAIGRSSGVPGHWMSGQKNLRLPVAGEVLFLTSPFIELLGTYPTWDAAVWWRTSGSDVLLCDIRVQSRSSLGTNHPEGLTNAFRV